MKRILIIVVIVVITSFGFVYAQTKGISTAVTPVVATSQNNSEDLKVYYQNYQNNIGNEFNGTYQFIISGNQKILITSETIDFINQNREKNNEVIVDLTSQIKIRILSEHEIRSKKFGPIEEMFIIQMN